MLEGSLDSKILFVSDYLRSDEAALGTILSEQRKAILVNALNRAGIPETDYAFTVMYPFMPPSLNLSKVDEEKKLLARIACKKIINDSKANVIVPLGDAPLSFITGLENINKQHCSILKVKAEFGARKAIPILHPESVQKSWDNQAYITFGCHRIKAESHSKNLDLLDRKFLLSLDLSFEQIISYLEDKVTNAPEVSIDVETGRGVVNTQGFAISPTEAIAIDVLPSNYSPAQFHKLWSVILKILQSKNIKKIAQNGLYESQWASLYGIELNGLSFDTMWAMKMLHPTLDKGLDNVGRIYTRQPYWKDDGKDWNNIRNWRDHLVYNCKDTCGAFEAKENMLTDLKQRGLLPMFESFMDKIFVQCQRMTNSGVLISEQRLAEARKDISRDLEALNESFDLQCEVRLGRKINANSPKQVKKALSDLKIKVPTKNGSETVSQEALAKIRKNYPEEIFVKDLIKINKLSNQLDAYFNFSYDLDKRLRFSIDAFHNEYGEWKSSKNPFGVGFSLDEVPRKTKELVMADEGFEFLEIRLHQPEITYLAYDSGDSRMIKIIQAGDSVPKQLAAQMFNKPVGIIHDKSVEARVAEQALYAAAYDMSPRAFATKVVNELGKSITEIEARRFLGVVFELFPKIRQRQDRIQASIRMSRSLKNPLGRSIVFYDRLNDELFKKAYQWGFKSTHADVLNHLMSCFDVADYVIRNNRSIVVQVKEGEDSYKLVSAIEENSWQHEIRTGYGSFKFVPRFRVGKIWGRLRDV